MKKINEIELMLKDLKIDIKVPTLELEGFMSSVQRGRAQEAYRNQTEDEKKLPLSRFWKNHDISPLLDLCSQVIAAEIVKNDFTYQRSKLPSTLNELIDKKIDQIRHNIEAEIMMKKINKESQEQKIAFLTYLNDKSWLKPS